MKKKILLASLMVAMLICLFAISTFAAEQIDGIYYTFSDTGATVSADNQKNCKLENVVIPEKVTAADGTVYTVTKIAEKAFGSQNSNGGNSNVKTVTLPSTVTSVGQYAFGNCPNIVAVNSKAQYIGSYMFYNCFELSSITLENTVTIKNHAFCNKDKSQKATSISLPEGLTELGQYAFARSSITSIVLPSTLETIGDNVFKDAKSLETVVVLGPVLSANIIAGCTAVTKVVLTENFVTFPNGALNGASSNPFIAYYTGTDYERIKTLCSSTSRFSGAAYYSYEDYISGNYTAKACMVIYDTNLCVAAFDGVHTEPNDDGNCETAVVCSMCNDYTYKSAKTHINAESITYTSFTQNGVYSVGCTNDGCKVATTETVKPLFDFSGVSSPVDGRGELVVGYTVNFNEIERYESITKTTLSYGVFAVLKDKLGSNDVFDENGNAAVGVIKADVSRDYVSFEFRITGFETDDHKALKLALGAYVIDSTGKIYYMQGAEPSEGEKYVFVSYSDINQA